MKLKSRGRLQEEKGKKISCTDSFSFLDFFFLFCLTSHFACCLHLANIVSRRRTCRLSAPTRRVIKDHVTRHAGQRRSGKRAVRSAEEPREKRGQQSKQLAVFHVRSHSLLHTCCCCFLALRCDVTEIHGWFPPVDDAHHQHRETFFVLAGAGEKPQRLQRRRSCGHIYRSEGPSSLGGIFGLSGSTEHNGI